MPAGERLDQRSGEVGFEASASSVYRPHAAGVKGLDLGFLHTGGDRSCLPTTSGCRCRADPAQTGDTSLEARPHHAECSAND